jgi:alcohol dehydrogenase
VFSGAGQPLELVELPIPSLNDRDVLVRVECCTLCGSDLHTITGRRQERTPSILGHEIVGRVAGLSHAPPSDVSGEPLRLGERVTWSVAAACGECDRCVRGYPQKCRQLVKYGHELAEGHYALSGGLAEYILLRPGSSVVKLDPSLPVELVCPANCATATIAAAYRVAGDVEARRVLILGAGMLGLTAIAMARAQRAASITVVDKLPDRLDQATRFGATATVQWQADSRHLAKRIAEAAGTEHFDVLLELSGATAACEIAIGLGDVGAQVVLVGSVMPTTAMRIDPESFVRRWLSLYGVHNYTAADLSTAVEFLRNHQHDFPFAELVEHTFDMHELAEAIRYCTRQRPIRVAIRP